LALYPNLLALSGLVGLVALITPANYLNSQVLTLKINLITSDYFFFHNSSKYLYAPIFITIRYWFIIFILSISYTYSILNIILYSFKLWVKIKTLTWFMLRIKIIIVMIIIKIKSYNNRYNKSSKLTITKFILIKMKW